MNRRFCAALVLVTLAGARVSRGQYLEAVIPTGDTPTEIIWNPAVNKVYCSNEQDASITVISIATNEVLTTIPVFDYPGFLCLNADESKLYCTGGENDDQLAVIDAVADTVIKTVTIPYRPGHMVMNTSMNKLYISCNDDPVYRITVLDAGADTVLRHVPARGVGRLLWHPTTNRVFSCGADTIRVIDCVTDQVVERTQGGGTVWCRSPVNDLVYLGARHSVGVLTPTGDSVVAVLPGYAGSLSAAPFPNKMYIKPDWDPLWVLDATADTLIKTIGCTGNRSAMCWNQTSSRVYVVDQQSDIVIVLRDTTTAVAESTPERESPHRPVSAVIRAEFTWTGCKSGQVIDAGGRRVAEVQPGLNDLGQLPAGVYVVVGADASTTTRLLKLR